MQEDLYQGDGLNLYAYCSSNPVTNFDPSGYGLKEVLDALEAFAEEYGEVDLEYWAQGLFSTYEQRLKQTPRGQYREDGILLGLWEGLRGESLYRSTDYKVKAIRANDVLRQYGQKGITYSNA